MSKTKGKGNKFKIDGLKLDESDLVYVTGIIPAIVRITGSHQQKMAQYHQLQQPIPSDCFELLSESLLSSIDEKENDGVLCLISQFCPTDDYEFRDLGSIMFDFVFKYWNLERGKESNHFLFLKPIFKPLVGLPKGVAYFTYVGIPFVIFGSEDHVATTLKQLQTNMTEEISIEIHNFFLELMGIDLCLFKPTPDCDLKEALDSIHQFFQDNFSGKIINKERVKGEKNE